MSILLSVLAIVVVLSTSKQFETTITAGGYEFGINVDIGNTKTTVTLSGSYDGVAANPNMALGFGNTEMDGTYAILIQTTPDDVSITETILSGSNSRGETTVTTNGNNWVQGTITEELGNFFMPLTRDNQVSCSGCYTFDRSALTLDMIWCVLILNETRNSSAIIGHSDKGIIQHLPAIPTYCRHNLVVEISNLNGISSSDFETNERLRVFITNATYNGIAQTVVIDQLLSIQHIKVEGIEPFFYEVTYNRTSDNVNITQSVCGTDYQHVKFRDLIYDTVSGDNDKISEYIREKTLRYFEESDNVSMDNMNVDVYFAEYDVASEKIEPKIMDIPSLYITIIILVLFLLFTLIALMDAKRFRKNDYFSPMELMTASLEVTDTILDLLFAVALLLLYIADNKLTQVLIASIASFIFIIIPITFSIFQLLRKQKKEWFNDDQLRIWLIDHGKILFALSIITGSSYAAIQIVNSGAFKLEIFNMGLSKLEKIKFNTKRVVGVVFLENMPQIAIQIWYLARFGVDFLPVLSIVFSMISIALTVLTLYTQKTIVKKQQIIIIEFDIIGNEIKPKLSTKTKAIKSEIGILLGLKASLIEIKRPKIISQGLRFEINLFVNTANDKASEYELKMSALVNNDNLMNIIKSEWNLNQSFKIENINVFDDKDYKPSVEIAQNRKYASIDKLDEDEDD